MSTTKTNRNPRQAWKEWAERFEAYEKEEYGKKIKVPAKCMFAEIEGPHKVACLETATKRSPDGYPVCEDHTGEIVRAGWRGFMEGA